MNTSLNLNLSNMDLFVRGTNFDRDLLLYFIAPENFPNESALLDQIAKYIELYEHSVVHSSPVSLAMEDGIVL